MFVEDLVVLERAFKWVLTFTCSQHQEPNCVGRDEMLVDIRFGASCACLSMHCQNWKDGKDSVKGMASRPDRSDGIFEMVLNGRVRRYIEL